jgi:biopolymer transport protein ExbB
MVMRRAICAGFLVAAGPVAAQTATAPAVNPVAPVLPALPSVGPDVLLPSLSPGTEPQASASLELMHLVLAAHWVVQGVMALLALAGFVVLTVLVYKTVEFAMANRRLSRALATVTVSPALTRAVAALAAQTGPGADMTRTAAAELAQAEADPALIPGTRDRVRAAVTRIHATAVMDLRAGTGVLASIGAIAPFVGLFGTVFGIMNSFLAIAETKTTNLAVVAPGIAEALLATAIGLAAAIPAVLFYNILSRRLGTFRHRLDDLATALDILASRALDRLAAQPAAPKVQLLVDGGR